jgi:hypothetical protein
VAVVAAVVMLARSGALMLRSVVMLVTLRALVMHACVALAGF